MVALRAAADRMMVDDLAFSIQAARAWTWVAAFLVDASQSLLALGADHTLWPTAWRCTDVARLT